MVKHAMGQKRVRFHVNEQELFRAAKTYKQKSQPQYRGWLSIYVNKLVH